MRDQQVLERLADTDEQQQERQPAEHRNLHDRIEARQHVGFQRARQAERDAGREAEQRAGGEADQHALQADQRVAHEIAARREILECIEHALGRRQDLRRDPAARAADAPQREQQRGQQPRREPPRPPLHGRRTVRRRGERVAFG